MPSCKLDQFYVFVRNGVAYKIGRAIVEQKKFKGLVPVRHLFLV
jgi:hypothetical protein